jgi:hypothetical protein
MGYPAPSRTGLRGGDGARVADDADPQCLRLRDGDCALRRCSFLLIVELDLRQTARDADNRDNAPKALQAPASSHADRPKDSSRRSDGIASRWIAYGHLQFAKRLGDAGSGQGA